MSSYYADEVMVETAGHKKGWVNNCPRNGTVRWYIHTPDGFHREIGCVALDDLNEESRQRLRQARRWSDMTGPEVYAKLTAALAKAERRDGRTSG